MSVDFASNAEQAVPAIVRMLSGCDDHQTSADVGNVSSFKIPSDVGPGGAGGACTNAMIKQLTSDPNCTWIDLLAAMRGNLKTKRFTQIPQLSSSRDIALDQPFDLNASKKGVKCLFIGINYIGQQGQLNGCHNDVVAMQDLLSKRFGVDTSESSTSVRVLMDDGSHTNPTRANILEAFEWFTAEDPDTTEFFFHYSGHGGNERDRSGDEKDGRDETMVPVDYASAGQILDDVLFEKVVLPLKHDDRLTVVMDCCHSGSIMDLPYVFKASGEAMDNVGENPHMNENDDFDWTRVFALGKKLMSMHASGASASQIAGEAFKALNEDKGMKAGLMGGLGSIASSMKSAAGGGSGSDAKMGKWPF